MTDNSHKRLWLIIGIVGKAHGLRGAFFVRDRDETFPDSYDTVRIGERLDKAIEYRVTDRRIQQNGSVISIAGINSKEQASALTGHSIWVDRKKVNLNSKEEFLWVDFEGKQVVTCDGLLLGTVASIYNAGASDIMAIVGDKGELDIPLIEDYVDFEQSELKPSVVLAVKADIFEDIWTEPKKNTPRKIRPET